jgi:hypothetical protein
VNPTAGQGEGNTDFSDADIQAGGGPTIIDRGRPGGWGRTTEVPVAESGSMAGMIPPGRHGAVVVSGVSVSDS